MTNPNPAEAKILAVIPCYNEEKSVGSVIKGIRALDAGIDWLVIDDGSLDHTQEVARSLGGCVRLIVNLGIGGAVQTGIRFAHQHGYDYCIQIDGDGQHPPEEIPQLIKKIRETGANLVIGSRFLTRSGFSSTRLRRIGIGTIVLAYRILFALKVTDPTSGFRIMDARAVSLFSDEYPQDFPEPISIARGVVGGLTVVEVPVCMRERTYGTSSISGTKTLIYMIRVLGNLTLVRLGRFFR